MTVDCADSDHTIEFLDSFADLEDPRQQAKVLYPLEEILLLCLCAVLSGADCWVEIALYGQQRLAFLRRFLPFEHGTPSHDQLGILFAKLDAEQFQRCFIAWVQRFTEAVRGVVAVDGKTLRRSFDHAAGQGPIHMISAWSSRQRMVLGQRQVDPKSNGDHRGAEVAGVAGATGCGREPRCDGYAACHRRPDHRPGSGLCVRAERKSGDPARGRGVAV